MRVTLEAARPLLADGWTLWRHVLVRGAGFPASMALGLGDEGWEERIREIAEEPLFREALIWQNREGAERVLASLARRAGGPRNRGARLAEAFIASYAQRYSMKNDTIGFFGPIGWGTLGEGAGAVRFQAGAPPLAERTVYFEPWAIRALAEALEAEPGVREQLPPRLHPRLRLEGELLFGTPDARSWDGSRRLPPAVGRALALCDGRTGAGRVADRLAAEGLAEVPDAAAALALLGDLAERGWLVWRFEIPVCAHPEEALRGQIEALQDAALRGRALEALDELLDARRDVAGAAGAPEALSLALGRLGEAFRRRTGRAPTRHAGQIYAGRSLVYEDCRRSLSLEVGAQVIERLSRPLSLLLSSARWYTHQIAERFRGLCHQIHAELKEGRLEGPVELGRLWDEALPWLDSPELVGVVADELRERWARLLEPDPEARRMDFEAAALAERARELFAAPGPGWPSARHHSPDILLAARGREALESGEYLLVLGELHPGLNTFSTLSAIGRHPEPAELRREWSRDLPPGQLTPLLDTSFARSFQDGWLAEADYHLDPGAPWASWRPESQRLRLGDCVVEEAEGGLRVRVRGGGPSFDLIQVFERPLKLRAAVEFGLLPPARHTPRITVDGLVLSRERWVFAGGELAFAELKTPEARYAAARGWSAGLGIPRFVFARASSELKPVFVDFESPPLVELLGKLARGSSRVDLTEMLPSPEELWLEDAAARRYVCELRLVAVDPEPWAPRGECLPDPS